MTQTVIAPTLEDIHLTPEDVARLADGTGNIPDDTARRLQAVIRCQDLARIDRIWRWIRAELQELRQMADDACVELLEDGRYIFHCFERLRTEPWTLPTDVLDPRLDVPYEELISMASALEQRAEGTEKVEMRNLIERIGAALSAQVKAEEHLEWVVRRLTHTRH